MAQTKLKSCIGCGGSSTTTDTYYARSTTAQITVIDCKQTNNVNYLTGFTFQAININSNQNNEITVKVFPNPTIDYLTIEGNIEGCIIKINDLRYEKIIIDFAYFIKLSNVLWPSCAASRNNLSGCDN